MLLEDSDKTYIYGAKNSPIAQIDKETSEITYLHGDERNSVILATDSAGEKLWDRKFNEYGVLLEGESLSKDSSNFGYAGEYYDSDIELYNLRARWYEPETASFISVDPLSLVTGENYSYASGNPLSFTDPLGLFSMGDLGASAAGIIDGLIGVPAVSTIANAVSPGSIDNCSAFYAGVAGVAGVASFFIPGGGALKGAIAAGKGISKVTGKVISRMKQAKFDEAGFAKVPGSSIKVSDRKIAGTYSDLDKIWKPRKGVYEINHIPTHVWNRDTGNINGFMTTPKNRSSLGPSIVMDKNDHRMLNSTKDNRYASKQISSGMSEKDVVIQDFLEITDINKFGTKYHPHAKAYAEEFGHIWGITAKDLGV